MPDMGRTVAVLDDDPLGGGLLVPDCGKLPKSDRLGLRIEEEDVEASLRRTRAVWGVCGRYLAEDDANDSSKNAEESAVKIEFPGELDCLPCRC